MGERLTREGQIQLRNALKARVNLTQKGPATRLPNVT